MRELILAIVVLSAVPGYSDVRGKAAVVRPGVGGFLGSVQRWNDLTGGKGLLGELLQRSDVPRADQADILNDVLESAGAPDLTGMSVADAVSALSAGLERRREYYRRNYEYLGQRMPYITTSDAVYMRFVACMAWHVDPELRFPLINARVTALGSRPKMTVTFETIRRELGHAEAYDLAARAAGQSVRATEVSDVYAARFNDIQRLPLIHRGTGAREGQFGALLLGPSKYFPSPVDVLKAVFEQIVEEPRGPWSRVQWQMFMTAETPDYDLHDVIFKIVEIGRRSKGEAPIFDLSRSLRFPEDVVSASAHAGVVGHRKLISKRLMFSVGKYAQELMASGRIALSPFGEAYREAHIAQILWLTSVGEAFDMRQEEWKNLRFLGPMCFIFAGFIALETFVLSRWGASIRYPFPPLFGGIAAVGLAALGGIFKFWADRVLPRYRALRDVIDRFAAISFRRGADPARWPRSAE